MIQPMPEAYEAAGQAYDAALDDEGWSAPVGTFLKINRAGLGAVVDAVWPLAEDRGRRWAIEALRDRAKLERDENPDSPTMWAVYLSAADYLESVSGRT